MGNSEVGHLNLGAGAVVKQDLTRIDEAVAGRLAGRERGAARRRSRTPTRVHLIGLVSDGGVHSGCEPPRGADRAGARELGVQDLVVHAFTDGRDTLPDVGRAASSRRSRAGASEAGDGARRLGHRPLLRDGPRQALGPHPAGLRPARARHAPSTTPTRGAEAARAAYERGETDEFITPTTVGDEARIRPGDSRHRASTSAPTACARSRARWPSPASTRSTAAAPRRSSATRR